MPVNHEAVSNLSRSLFVVGRSWLLFSGCKVSNSVRLSYKGTIRYSVDRTNSMQTSRTSFDGRTSRMRCAASSTTSTSTSTITKSLCEILIWSSLFFCGSHVKEVDEARSRIRARISIRPREPNEVFREYAKN